MRIARKIGFVTALLLAGCVAKVGPGGGPAATSGTAAGRQSEGSPGVKGAEPLVISRGERVNLPYQVVKGKHTIFDFSSKYCGPCQQIAPYLARLHTERDDLAVVTVDINRPTVKGIDWDSPVAREFRLGSIPHFKIYNPSGQLESEGEAATDRVLAWIKEL